MDGLPSSDVARAASAAGAFRVLTANPSGSSSRARQSSNVRSISFRAWPEPGSRVTGAGPHTRSRHHPSDRRQADDSRKARPRRRSKSIAEGRFELFDGAIAGNYLKKCRNMK
jgi:hypothetical protein